MPATNGNLFHVSGIFEEKRLWDILRFMETQKAYNIEVRPVAPPAGLLTGPTTGPVAAANDPDALVATMTGGRRPRADEGASGRARRAVAAVVAADPTATFTHKELVAHGADAKGATNTVFLLIRAKLLKRVSQGTYRATARLLAGPSAGAAE